MKATRIPTNILWMLLSFRTREAYSRFERFYFNEPYYHSDESDPLSNTPHGYLITDDVLNEILPLAPQRAQQYRSACSGNFIRGDTGNCNYNLIRR